MHNSFSDQVQFFLEKNNQPTYRLAQFNQAYYQHLINSFDELTTWSKDLRAQLAQQLEFSTLTLLKEQISADGNTIKVLFSLNRQPELKLETVLMRYRDGRNSVCVSCMVGCPVGCTFCATGQMGLKINLTSREIIDQVLYFARLVNKEEQKISNVTYMGMGEPLLNLEAVEASLDVLMAEDKFGLGKRRITISTAGFPDQLKKLIDDGYRPRLALSLHAPDQELREQIMPIAKNYPLDQVFEAIDYYVEKTNKLVTYEYLLLKGVNDSDALAKQLGHLLKNRLAHVNLIPVNPVDNTPYQRPTQERVRQFSKVLAQSGVSNTVRVTMGDDIKAACGQLSTE